MRLLARLSIALVLAALLPARAAEARRVALVIGNGVYSHAEALANPIKDATAIARALERLRFDRVTLVADADVQAMRKVLLEFEVEANGAEIALVYYAGHGIEVDGLNYLIPTDARLRTSGAVEVEAVALSTITTMMSGARSLRLVILDACRNNPFRPQMLADASRKRRMIGRGLKAVEPGENELIAFAAASGTEADDGQGGHSPFTAALLRHIERPELEIGQLFRVVRDDVVKATGREQTPHVYGTLGSEQIYLSRGRDGNRVAAVAPSSDPVHRPTGNPDDRLRTARQKAEHALLLADAARRSAEHRQSLPTTPQSELRPSAHAQPEGRQPDISQPEIKLAEEERKPVPAIPAVADLRRQPPAACESLEGDWTWFGRYLTVEVAFKADGSGPIANGVRGRWTCANGRYRISWANGFADHVVMSPDGRRLSGTSWAGNAVSARRK